MAGGSGPPGPDPSERPKSAGRQAIYTCEYTFLTMRHHGGLRSVLAEDPTGQPPEVAVMTSTATSPTMTAIRVATGAGDVLGLAPCRGGRMALADAGMGRAVSYPELARTVRAAAAGLARRGVRPGDVVALLLADAVSFSIASLVVWAVGAVPFPVSAGAAAGDAAAQLSAADARVLLTSVPLAPEATALADRSRVRQVICFGPPPGRIAGAADDGTPPGTTPFASLLEYGTMPPLARDGGDPALLCYPSGPQESRRPAWITHRALAADLHMLAAGERITGWDVVIAAPPCGSGRRYTALLHLALSQGATVIAAGSAGTGDLLAAARQHLATAVIAPTSAGLPDELSVRVLTVAPEDRP